MPRAMSSSDGSDDGSGARVSAMVPRRSGGMRLAAGRGVDANGCVGVAVFVCAAGAAAATDAAADADAGDAAAAAAGVARSGCRYDASSADVDAAPLPYAGAAAGGATPREYDGSAPAMASSNE